MNTKHPFIIIDDSELDRYVTQKFLERSNYCLTVSTFHDVQQALDGIRDNPVAKHLAPVIILLDLQMPLMSGYDFVEEFEKLPPEVQKNYRIAVLTILNSINNPTELHKLQTYKTVNQIIHKPLTKEKLTALLNAQ